MNGQDARVLGALSAGDGDYFDYLRTVAAELDMPHREVRVRVRRLARKGYARIEHLFNDTDGLTAGSTYVTTREGQRILAIYRSLRDAS